MADRPERNPVRASYWQWDPEAEDPDVTAMPAALSFERSDHDRVLVAIRGKPGRRYEHKDAAWIELEDDEVLRLIERLAATLRRGVQW